MTARERAERVQRLLSGARFSEELLAVLVEREINDAVAMHEQAQGGRTPFSLPGDEIAADAIRLRASLTRIVHAFDGGDPVILADAMHDARALLFG